MILVDTSVWVSFFRFGNTHLQALLDRVNIVCHPFIIGELACGNLQNREEILSLLKALPQAVQAEQTEVLQFIEHHRLMGLGLGYIDAHLLASALLTPVYVWTMDKKLKDAALSLNISYKSP